MGADLPRHASEKDRTAKQVEEMKQVVLKEVKVKRNNESKRSISISKNKR